jgi:hypothetical protein
MRFGWGRRFQETGQRPQGIGGQFLVT